MPSWTDTEDTKLLMSIITTGFSTTGDKWAPIAAKLGKTSEAARQRYQKLRRMAEAEFGPGSGTGSEDGMGSGGEKGKRKRAGKGGGGGRKKTKAKTEKDLEVEKESGEDGGDEDEMGSAGMEIKVEGGAE